MEHIADALAARIEAEPFRNHHVVLSLDIHAAGKVRDERVSQDYFLVRLFEAAFQQVQEANAILVVNEAQWLDSDAELRVHARTAFEQALGLFQADILVVLLYWSEDEFWNRDGKLASLDLIRERGVLENIERQDVITVEESSVSDTYDLIDKIFVARWVTETNCHFMQDAFDDALDLSPYIQSNQARLLRPYQTVFLARDLTDYFPRESGGSHEPLDELIRAAFGHIAAIPAELGVDQNRVRKALLGVQQEGIQTTPEGRSMIKKGHVWAYLLSGRPYGLTERAHGVKGHVDPHSARLWVLHDESSGPQPTLDPNRQAPNPRPGRVSSGEKETGPAATN